MVIKLRLIYGILTINPFVIYNTFLPTLLYPIERVEQEYREKMENLLQVL